MTGSEGQLIAKAVTAIKKQCDLVPQVVLITGTGLGALADDTDTAATISYSEIPGFPVSKVSGHAGRLLLGHLVGVPVAILDGRCHLYEGWNAAEIVRPLRTLANCGARGLLVTNNAGSLNPDFLAPGVMLLADQINMTGNDPGTGPQEEETGLRFADMTNCYDPDLRKAAQEHAGVMSLPMYQGIYCGLRGPALESPAERRFLRKIGGDAVGMSTVLETIAARALGMRVLGFSALANMATGGPEQQPDTLEAILAGACEVAGELAKLIRLLLPVMAEKDSS